MIRTAIRFQNNMVVVLDGEGEQIPEYQGQYEEVKESILKDALPDAVFGHWADYEAEFEVVSIGEW